MALRAYYEFTNDKDVTYRVELHGPDLFVDPAEWVPTSDGFTLTYDGGNDEPLRPIVGSKVEFTVYDLPLLAFAAANKVSTIITALPTADEGSFTLQIYLDPDDTNTLFWAGVILPEQITINDEDRASVTFTAADDLANLKKIPFNDDGEPYIGPVTFRDIIMICLRLCRNLDAWNTGDHYLVTQRYINTATAIADSSADPYLYHKVYHEHLYEGSGVNIEYKTAYEVLEQVAQLFTAQVFLSNGKWWFLPQLRRVSAPTLSVNIYDRGFNTLATNSSLFPFASIVTDPLTSSASPYRLNGFENSMLHPIRAAEMTYNFRGALPIIGATTSEAAIIVEEADFGVTEYENDFFVLPQGGAYNIYCKLIVNQDGSLARNGAQRAIRYKVSLKMEAGAYYLKRTATAAGSSSFTLSDGLSLNVFNLLYSGGEWTATDTDRAVAYSQVIDARYGDSIDQVLFFPLVGIPADSAGVICTWFVEAYNAENVLDTDALDEATVEVRFNVRSTAGEGGGIQNSIIYRGDFDNNAREVIELQPTIFGEQISSLNTHGSIRYDDLSYTEGDWIRENTAGELPILSQLVRTHAQHRHRAPITHAGTLYHAGLYFYDLIFHNPGDGLNAYYFTSMKFNAGMAEYDIELMELRLSGTITVATADRFDDLPAVAVNQIASIQGLQSTFGGIENTLINAANKIGGLQPAGVGGVVLKNAEGDADAVTYLPKAGITKSVQLPTTFAWFITARSRVTSTDLRYLSLSTLADFAAIEYATQFIVPFDGETGLLHASVSVSEDVLFAVYINGALAASDTETFVSGVPRTVDLSGQAFSAGDVIVIAIDGTTNPPLDTVVTLELVAD
jgi:hypothetical protein